VLCRNDVRPARPVRKAIFSLRLWQPMRQRLHSQRVRLSVPGLRRRPLCTDSGPAIGCVNARSVGNKSAILSRCITDERLEIRVITETWHERSDSVELKRVVPPGYKCIDAARPIPSDARRDTADFQNHGGLASVYSQAVEFQQRQLDLTVTTFEYL